jgi:amino acid adenylation domain-containing protein
MKFSTVTQMAEVLSRWQKSEGELESLREKRREKTLPVSDLPRGIAPISFSKEELEQSIPERFEKIVRLYPDHIAVKTETQGVSYAELNAMANRVAREIVKRQGTESEPVGLLIDKGVEQIAAMLGILKAGKFFVLLDSTFPLERNAAISKDTRPPLILVHTDNVAYGSKLIDSADKLINVSTIDSSSTSDDLYIEISPDAISNVIYTSGSTGTPKGVIQTHRSKMHLVMLHTQILQITCKDRCILLSSGTASTIGNSLYALLNGAALHPYSVNKLGISKLADWMVDEKITICAISAPLFRKFCESLTGAERFPDLRALRLTSEASYKSDFELYKRFSPQTCCLANVICPTETGTLRQFVMYHDSQFRSDEIPLGYPVDDKEIYLLDEDGREVGFNEVGEIVVRSKYLSPGYWNRPELTEAKFKADPQDPEQRFYYTGDLGLMLPDGCLIHKGRKDFRVKIRGYGVETAEVEKVLRGHGVVKDCVVVDRRDQSGETKLVAYYISGSQRQPNSSELRQYLKASLPDYMVPSSFQRLDAIPLTPSGKVDRQALPEPDTTRPEMNVRYEAPRTPVERKIAQFWAKALSVERVGLHDDFFELGGHSLSGTLVVSWIHDMFGLDLPVSEFFSNPTIAQLAERIEGGERENHRVGKKQWTYLCELQKGKGRAPVFIFPGGGGGEPEFFVYGFLARQVGTEYPFYGLRARGADGVLQPHATAEQMADAYVEEIRALHPEGPYYLIGECAGGVNACEAARQLMAQGQEIAMLVLMDVELPTPIKYLRYRTGKRLEPVREFLKGTVWKWYSDNYYFSRLPYHLRQLAALSLREYPGYLAGRLAHSLTPPEKNPPIIDSRRKREEIVLYTTASGSALRHIERVRENYRRTVRRFHPKPYNGPIEIIVSEKLYRRDPTLGWKKLVLKGLSIHPVPGDHWSYIRDHVDVVGLKLRECLARAEERI